MKTKTLGSLIAASALAFFAFTTTIQLKNCYVSYKGSKTLSATAPFVLPPSEAKPRKVTTNNGEVEISQIEGCKIEYNNTKNSPFVDLKVVLSSPQAYTADTANVVAYLKYLNSITPNMETKDLIQLNFNGYKIYGISSSVIEKSKRTLGSFVVFPGNNTILYIDFNNLRPEQRDYETIIDYKTKRNGFLGDYTLHLKNCADK